MVGGMIGRRQLLGAGGAALAGAWLAPLRAQARPGAAFAAPQPLAPILARPDRMFRLTVCLRPFRAAGPRIAMERIAGRRVLHHYGHGGSGWSLSWGSAMEIMPMVLATGVREVAVVGAGAIGLTTAITAQRMGLKVVIYAKDRFPDVRSARATGTWSPHSRIAMDEAVDAGFAARWERMARRSFAMHQAYLGLPGDPVEWTERYTLSDTPPVRRPHGRIAMPDGSSAGFVNYESQVADLVPRNDDIAPDQHPFAVPFARRTTTLTFNVTDLAHQLETDFQLAGGRFVPMELASPADFARIRERLIINCTGYGARALMNDASIIPVRGQIAWLLPQPDVRYGLLYRQVSVLARRDGIVVQAQGLDEGFGFNVADEAPDIAAARDAIAVIAGLFSGNRPAPA